MTLQEKLEENTRLIRNYLDFLEEVTEEKSRLKLITEIGRLNLQNEEIQKLNENQRQRPWLHTTITANALLKRNKDEKTTKTHPYGSDHDDDNYPLPGPIHKIRQRTQKTLGY